MLAPLWNTFLLYPLVNTLIFLYLLTGSLGWAIVLLTLFLRLAMTPLVLPSLRLTKKMAELAPEITKLKHRYKDDKQGLLAAQAQLYKAHGANPASGCLPQILQLLILIALFNALNLLLTNTGNNLVDRLQPLLYSFNHLPADFHLSTGFFYLDLIKPDVIRLPSFPVPLPGLLLLLSALTQFLSGKMLSPVVKAEKRLAEKTPTDSDDAMVAAQQQMLYFLPFMTIIFGFNFPSGLVLYWFVFSLLAIVQQYFVTGWGGLQPWISRLRMLKLPSSS